jgi:hypothetical protein
MLAQTMVMSVLPDTDLFDDWAQFLPEPWPSPLADAVVQGHRALQTVSALGVLDARRGTAGVDQSKVDQEITRLREALDTMSRLQPQDAVVTGAREMLVSLADRVQSEFDDHAPEESTLAAGIALGTMNASSNEITNLGAAIILALTWDTDPGGANALLQAWERAAAEAENAVDGD